MKENVMLFIKCFGELVAMLSIGIVRCIEWVDKIYLKKKIKNKYKELLKNNRTKMKISNKKKDWVFLKKKEAGSEVNN